MKKQVLLLSFLAAFLLCGFLVYAAESKEAPKKKPSSSVPVKPSKPEGVINDPSLREKMPAGRIRQETPGDPEAAFRNRLHSQVEVHQELIRELTEIKKIAEEEGAEKTSEALQKLIDQRNETHRQRMLETQRRRLEAQKRIQERMKAREQKGSGETGAGAVRPGKAARKGTANKAEESN